MPQRGNPDVDPPAAAGIEQIYADIRSRLGSGTGGEVAPSTAAPGIAVVPLRTPTLPPATHTG